MVSELSRSPVAVHDLSQRLRLVLELVALRPAERLVIVLERHPAREQHSVVSCASSAARFAGSTEPQARAAPAACQIIAVGQCNAQCKKLSGMQMPA